jgi:hypothetical protein
MEEMLLAVDNSFSEFRLAMMKQQLAKDSVARQQCSSQQLFVGSVGGDGQSSLCIASLLRSGGCCQRKLAAGESFDFAAGDLPASHHSYMHILS